LGGFGRGLKSGGLVSFVKVFTLPLGILFSASLLSADNPAYQKGTVTAVTAASKHKSYNLKAGMKVYQINNCGDFQDGQEVEFFVRQENIYIAHAGAKDYKCSIELTTTSADPNASPTSNESPASIYQKGIILGYSVRRDVQVSGGGGGAGGPLSVGSSARKAKVYELQGPDLVYQVDYCGVFQAGQFTPGQEVEFRVDKAESRLYIRHDGNKEYSCQLEGTRKPDASPENAAPSIVSASAIPSTAKLSIVSVPDGADIEIDGNFAGNTPSDLEVAPGVRSIVVKKSGYKNWERKMTVAAGSNIHLNAEMEKSSAP
jgi:hypothetical protein